MIAIILKESQLNRAGQILSQYNCRLSYSRVYLQNECYFVISEGPLGALLTIRAELGDRQLQERFGLL